MVKHCAAARCAGTGMGGQCAADHRIRGGRAGPRSRLPLTPARLAPIWEKRCAALLFGSIVGVGTAVAFGMWVRTTHRGVGAERGHRCRWDVDAESCRMQRTFSCRARWRRIRNATDRVTDRRHTSPTRGQCGPGRRPSMTRPRGRGYCRKPGIRRIRRHAESPCAQPIGNWAISVTPAVIVYN